MWQKKRTRRFTSVLDLWCIIASYSLEITHKPNLFLMRTTEVIVTCGQDNPEMNLK